MEESAEIAEKILLKLLEIDEENISRAAKAGWYKPLIDCIVQGKRNCPQDSHNMCFVQLL